MALPNNTDLNTTQWSFGGSPFVQESTNTNVNTFTMAWSFGGAPFITNPVGAVGPTNIKSLFGVAKANIKSINGVPLANIKSINGVA